MTKQSLPLGSSDFVTLRTNNEIYVDKTEMMYRLACERAKLFLARPRRFGKSLLISAFDSLFRTGLKHFHGLAIEALWSDQTYNVVHLDFSETKDFLNIDQFRDNFYRRIQAEFARIGFKPSGDLATFPVDISIWLSEQPQSSLALLIDEYDAPLTACLGKPELFNEVRVTMSEFFSTIKRREGCLRFFFMTGITKFSSTGIFSAFNNIRDISLSPDYGTLLGYTEKEITDHFQDYLTEASHQLGLSNDVLLDRLRENYNGFCFDRKALTRVYCPWSVLNFLQNPADGFLNYWYNSGGQPTVLMNYLSGQRLANPETFAQAISVPLSALESSNEYSDMDIKVLLTQAGYYTIKSVGSDRWVTLGYPNEEVARSMASLYATQLLRGQRWCRSDAVGPRKILETGSIPDVVDFLNWTLNLIDYQNFPITNEASCRTYIQVLMLGSNIDVCVEKHSALGRSDLEATVGNRHWVFEFKFARKSDNVQTLLEQAAQQIRSRRYGLAPHGKHLLRLALVFGEKERRFVAYKEVR